MPGKKERILSAVLFIYFLCFAFRCMEYFVLRTDETFWSEAFVHKLIGIVILFIAGKSYGFSLTEIGFVKGRVLRSLSKGVIFGLCIFVLAYAAEIMIILMQGKLEALDLYVSAYSVNGAVGAQTGILFFAICIAGNIINVIMEEGIFRGLFQKMLEKKYSFLPSAVIGSVLFGLWHVMAPARSYYDGAMSLNGFIANAILLSVTSGLVGFQFALITKLTGNLYMAMGYHFVNNTIVNMLHVVSSTGADELMTVRVAIAQSVSFVIILAWFLRTQRIRSRDVGQGHIE